MAEAARHGLGWWQWSLLLIVAALAVMIGHGAARLVGFSYYPGAQGVLMQQPLPLAAMSLVAMLIAVAVAARIGLTLTRPMDARFGVALGLLAFGGFAWRGGSMASVMLASDGNELFWLLAAEMVVLGLIGWGIFAARHRMGGLRAEYPGMSRDATAAVVQLVVFVAMMLVLGRSLDKGQAVGAVLGAGVLATVLTRLLIGRVWTEGWSVPLIGAVIGYVACALTLNNVDIANPTGVMAGLSVAQPLDYIAFGPAGVLLGELLYGHEETELQPARAV